MTDQPTGDPIGDTSPETAHALLWRHGLPEDVIDGALALHAGELAAVQRAAISKTDDPVFYEGEAGWLINLITPGDDEPVPVVPVSSPPPDQTALRDRIAEALAAADGWTWTPDYDKSLSPVWQGYLKRADVVLPALPPPADRAAVLREAAEHLLTKLYGAVYNDAGQKAADGVNRAVRELLDLADADELRRLAAEAQQPDTETQAHPPQYSWRVETRDPLADQWAPGSRFAHRPAAVERWETANRTAPLWRDGTPVERRIVRETTTYTVEAPPPVHKGGNADDCPACIAGGLDTIGPPYECPGNETRA